MEHPPEVPRPTILDAMFHGLPDFQYLCRPHVMIRHHSWIGPLSQKYRPHCQFFMAGSLVEPRLFNPRAYFENCVIIFGITKLMKNANTH